MSRLFFPLALSAAAFTVVWCLTPPSGAPGEAGSAGGISGAVSVPGAALTGLARREAWLVRMETTDIGGIRRLLEAGNLSYSEALMLAHRWAGMDPAGFWQWSRSRGAEKYRSMGFSTLAFTAWCQVDPKTAIPALGSLDFMERLRVTGGLLGCLAGTDDALWRKLTPFLDELVDLTGANLPVNGEDIPKACAKLMEAPPGEGRDRLLQRAAQMWMNEDWKAASTWLGTLTEPLKSQMMSEAVSSAFAPAAVARARQAGPGEKLPAGADLEGFAWASQWFTTEAPPEVRRRLAGRFVESLAARDPAAALEWAQGNLSAGPLTSAIAKIFGQEALKDPAAARALVENLPPGGGRLQAAMAVVKKPSAESVDWLLSQTPPVREDTVSTGGWWELGARWAFEDPAAFKNYVESKSAGNLPPYFVRSALDNLLRKDAAGTLDWMAGTQTPKEAGMALESWSRTDLPASAAWLKEHAATVDWDPGTTRTVSGQYFHRSPTEAVDWAATLPAGPVRTAALDALSKSLAASTALPAEERTRLEAKLGKP